MNKNITKFKREWREMKRLDLCVIMNLDFAMVLYIWVKYNTEEAD